MGHGYSTILDGHAGDEPATAAFDYDTAAWQAERTRTVLRAEVQRLPSDTLLTVGVEPKGGAEEEQEQWCFRGESGALCALKRCADKGDMTARTFSIADFTVLGFVCGELWDGGSGFDAGRHTRGVDLVLDLAHASVNRSWDRTARPWPRGAFQRAFKDLGKRCGAMLSHAHDVDPEPVPSYARRQDNWIVFKGEDPFPDEDSYEIHRLS